ncbi:MAG: hypothetical protein MUF21_14665 [Gemmatimonadaceae bacterium]|nr:hypothetical protein [Gemmatimonadaceae bacterium]
MRAASGGITRSGASTTCVAPAGTGATPAPRSSAASTVPSGAGAPTVHASRSSGSASEL